MSIEHRKIAKTYRVTAESVDRDVVVIAMEGETLKGRQLKLAATIHYRQLPHLIRKLSEHWHEAKQSRLNEIELIDRVTLPKPTQGL